MERNEVSRIYCGTEAKYVGGLVLKGAEIFLECLREEGVTDIFGYPGGAILDIYEALYHCDFLKHYLVRHEQAAVHAAEGYARITGKVGTVLVTSGPGACNTITGIANAYYDAYPLVIFTGQVGLTQIGNDAFQEADIVGITRTCCKHNYLVKNVKDLSRIVKEAYHIAKTGKPGPVVVDLPKSVLNDKCEFKYPDKIKLPGYNPNYQGHPKQIEKALHLLKKAKQPVIIIGGGVVKSQACEQVKEFSTKLNIPVCSTLMGLGCFDPYNQNYLGMLGMHGTFCANQAVSNCDVLFAIGTRFNDRITGCLKTFAKNAKVIHIDIDPCSISKNVRVDVPIVGDARLVLDSILEQLEKDNEKIEDKSNWFEEISKWKKNTVPLSPKTQYLSPITVIKYLFEYTKDKDPIICTEVGQHQMWTAQIFKFKAPRRFITSGGLGTMGFGFPAAIGAQIANPDKLVINIAGDGSIQMNIQELATCVQYNLPIIVAIINNGYLGMVRQWQEKLYEKHYSQTQISNPNFVQLAKAYGANGFRVEKEEDIRQTLNYAIEQKKPALIDFRVEPFERVYPWVLAGKPINEVILSCDF